MKHNTANRRSRNRGGGKRQGGGRNNYESNGPEGKVRGTAQQVLDKYLVLARDAASAGDRIKSESYFQFAEHYYRIVIADGANNNANRREGQHPQETASVEGNMSRTVVEPQTITEGSEVSRDELTNTAQETVVEAKIEKGKIDESVLPAAAPTSRPPRRRRKVEMEVEAKAKAEEELTNTPEPEVA